MKENMKLYRTANWAVLALAVITTVLSFHPAFLKIDDNEESFNPLSKYVLLLAIFAFLMNYEGAISLKYDFCKTYCKCLVIVILISFILVAFSISNEYLQNVRQLLLPLLFFLIGFTAKIDIRQMRILVNIYILMVLFIGVSQVMTNIGGFYIMDQYAVSAKNRIACLISFASILSLCLALNEKMKYIRKILLFFIYFLLFFVLLTIRGRTGVVATALVSLVVVFKYVKYKKLKSSRFVFIFALFSIILLISFFLFNDILISFYNYIDKSLFASFEGGDITNGRMSRNVEAVSVFLEHPFFGRLGTGITIPWVHNYLLLVLSSYGIVCGGVMVFLYIYILVDIITHLRKNKWSVCFGCFPMIVLYIVSLAEPTLPYGPGTIVFFPYFLYGYNKQMLK